MASTYLSLHYHVVFAVKNRVPTIAKEWQSRLHDYLGGTIRGLGGFPQEIGGVADHVHILMGLKATHGLANMMREIKKSSSAWVHQEINNQSFAWQEGFVANKHAHYVLTVKANQATLLDDITTCFLKPGQPHFETTNKGHGRLEHRQIWCSEELNSFINFPFTAQIFRIDRQITHTKANKTTKETAYGISSLSTAQADPARMLSLVRGHWSIENRLHYVRDTTFDEDRSQIRSASGQRVMASLRNLAIGLIRIKTPKRNIAGALRQNAMKPHLALKLMGL